MGNLRYAHQRAFAVPIAVQAPWRPFLVAIVALALVMPLSIAGSAFAQEDFTCEDFQHNEDGSWAPLKDMTIAAPNGQIELGPGVSLTVGLPILDLDLAAALNEKCK
jgi:hypothetical protein